MVKAWAELHEMQPLDEAQTAMATAPLSEGGLGLQALTPRVEAAFLAAEVEAANDVYVSTGVDPLKSGAFEDAKGRLKDRYGLDLWEVLRITHDEALLKERAKQQVRIGKEVERFLQDRRVARLSPGQRETMAAGAAGNGDVALSDWLTARPRKGIAAFTDAEWKVMVAAKLRARLVVGGVGCRYSFRSKAGYCTSPLRPQLRSRVWLLPITYRFEA